jgi:hypothetical protein
MRFGKSSGANGGAPFTTFWKKLRDGPWKIGHGVKKNRQSPRPAPA